LAALAEKYRQLEEQRARLVENRRELLDELIQINDQIIEEAKIYQQAIEQDRDSFFNRFPELQPLGASIIASREISDPVRRQQEYERIKGQLVTLLDEFTAQEPQYSERLHGILGDIDRIVNKEEEVLAACSEPVKCINGKLDDLKDELKAASGKILDSAQEDILTIQDMTVSIRRQYEVLGENLQANDEQIKNNNELLEGEFKHLAENLVSVTAEDLSKVMETYKEIQIAQQELLTNISLHEDRVVQSQQETDQKAAEIIKKLYQVPRMDFDKLAKAYDNIKTERQQILAKFESNELKLRQVTDERWHDDSDFLDKLVRGAPLDGNKLVEDREYAARRTTNTHLNLLPAASDSNNFERNNDLKTAERPSSAQTHIDNNRPSLKLKDSLADHRLEATSDDYKRLKSQARDQGF
jgi:hypothetical protein